MREYEATIIVQPEISDEGTSVIFEKLDKILTQAGSERLFCENLGKRKLAYEINKFHKGHYYILSYLDEGQVVPELERAMRLDESVLRFMTILVDPKVADVEGRKAQAREAEADQERKAVERATREAEEAKARAEIERQAAEEAAKAAAAAEAEAAKTAAEAAKTEAEASEGEAAAAEETDAPKAAEAAAEDTAEASTEDSDSKDEEKTS